MIVSLRSKPLAAIGRCKTILLLYRGARRATGRAPAPSKHESLSLRFMARKQKVQDGWAPKWGGRKRVPFCARAERELCRNFPKSTIVAFPCLRARIPQVP